MGVAIQIGPSSFYPVSSNSRKEVTDITSYVGLCIVYGLGRILIGYDGWFNVKVCVCCSILQDNFYYIRLLVFEKVGDALLL